jgi:hypothetical protein
LTARNATSAVETTSIFSDDRAGHVNRELPRALLGSLATMAAALGSA